MDISQTPDNNSDLSSSPKPSLSRIEAADEISLVDILKFLTRHLKVIGSVVLATILMGLGTFFVPTPQFRRELSLNLEFPPELKLNASINNNVPLILSEVVVSGNQALNRDVPNLMYELTQSSPVNISLTTASEENPERLKIVLTGEDETALQAAEQPSLDTLQSAAGKVIESYIEPEIDRLDLLIKRSQMKISLLENRLTMHEIIPGENSISFSDFLKLQQQAQQQTILAHTLSNLDDYKLERQSLSDLQNRSESIFHVEILMAIQTQESSSLMRRLVLSTISGLMLGVLVALIVDQLPKLRAALSISDS